MVMIDAVPDQDAAAIPAKIDADSMLVAWTHFNANRPHFWWKAVCQLTDEAALSQPWATSSDAGVNTSVEPMNYVKPSDSAGL
jgi:hypothetical protein